MKEEAISRAEKQAMLISVWRRFVERMTQRCTPTLFENATRDDKSDVVAALDTLREVTLILIGCPSWQRGGERRGRARGC